MQSTIIGIRKTNAHTWCVVLAEPTSPVPGRQAPILSAGAEFSGPGAKARAIRAAGTNTVIEGSAREVARVAS